jgi:hypothetical protein
MRGFASKTERRRESQGGLEEGAAIWVFAKIAMSGGYKSDEHADDHNSTLLSAKKSGAVQEEDRLIADPRLPNDRRQPPQCAPHRES